MIQKPLSKLTPKNDHSGHTVGPHINPCAMAAQLARLSGARTIAITSGEVKRRIALDHLRYDHCIDRKEDDVDAALSDLAPDGVSVYFDLVGDPTLTIVAQQLSIGGRVVLCGLIKDYNGDHKTTGPHPGLWITKRATVSGLVVYDYEPQRSNFEQEFVPLAPMEVRQFKLLRVLIPTNFAPRVFNSRVISDQVTGAGVIPV